MSVMCSYQDCLCVKYPCSSIAFFRLPSDNRRMTWIRNSGNKSLINISEKAHRFFCENHFRLCDIRTQFNRKILRKHAVPIEHKSSSILVPSKVDSAPHQSTEENKKEQRETNFVIEKLEEDTVDTQLYESVQLEEFEIPVNNDPTDALGDSYTLLDFCPTENFSELQDQNEEHAKPDILREIYTEPETFYDEETNANQVDSSTIDIHTSSDFDDVDTEPEVPVKKRKANEVALDKPDNSSTYSGTSSNDYQEDKHFALSLVGYFQRLPMEKKALAKLKILKYLTELDIGFSADL